MKTQIEAKIAAECRRQVIGSFSRGELIAAVTGKLRSYPATEVAGMVNEWIAEGIEREWLQAERDEHGVIVFVPKR
jgi:hypothetical protein